MQETDANGKLTFQTIFPAAYSGRWPHMHFEVYESLDAATSGGAKLKTSQLALPKDVVRHGLRDQRATSRACTNLAQTSLDARHGLQRRLRQPAGDGRPARSTSGLTIKLNVGV